jgi:hypothetical protein
MIYIDEPGQVRWKAVQGSTFYKAFTMTQNGAPVNLTGWTAKLGGKTNINQSALDIDLSTTGATITLGGVAGTILINPGPTVTRTWPVGNVQIQFEFIEGAAVVTYLVGIITVSKEIPV